jgi:hypothetical protein
MISYGGCASLVGQEAQPPKSGIDTTGEAEPHRTGVRQSRDHHPLPNRLAQHGFGCCRGGARGLGLGFSQARYLQ